LEGLYTLCLMFESPSWIDVYLKDGWKKQYVRLLLECYETQELERFQEFCKKTAPRNLDALRMFLGITDAQVATINNEEIGTPMPEGIAKEKIERFPTPSGVINKLPTGDKRRLLERLYAEYAFLCSFAHGLPEALLFKMMFNKNPPVPHAFDDEKMKDTFHRQVEQPAYTTSLISLVQAASELTALYPSDVELRAAWSRHGRRSCTECCWGESFGKSGRRSSSASLTLRNRRRPVSTNAGNAVTGTVSCRRSRPTREARA
jgi:hypothetical protein